MPHDRFGIELKLGDRVVIPAMVKEVFQSEDACNATFEIEANSQYPDEYRPLMTFNTRLVEKLPEAATRLVELAEARRKVS